MVKDPRAPLHPQVKILFDLMDANRAERVLAPEPLREGLSALAPLLSAGGPEVAAQRELRIPAEGGEIRAVAYWPADPDAGPYPLLVYLHGGGYVVMSPETHDRLAREICVGSGSIVVSVDYRLAPEFPYPAPLDDCVAAFRWVRDHADELSGDATRIAVGGDSAGGNASAALCLRLIAAGETPPRAALLLCPWTDMALDTGSMRRFGPGDGVLDDELMRFFRDSYVKPDQHDDPFASPLRGDLSSFPECCVVVGTIDPLHDDGMDFARRLEAAGRPVTLESHEGMPHDFMLFPGLDEGPISVERACRFLTRVLA